VEQECRTGRQDSGVLVLGLRAGVTRARTSATTPAQGIELRAHPTERMNDSTTLGSDGRRLFSVAQIQHVLRTEFGRSQRYKYPVSVIVLAIDQLGAVRDRVGYDAKEAIVEGVLGLLFASTRSSDYLGRTPDDRLIAVIPHTDERITLSIGATSSRESEALFHDVLYAAAEAAQSDATAAGGDRFVARPPVQPGI
jgi:diguanylate cyclase (GGDEF)-like protein